MCKLHDVVAHQSPAVRELVELFFLDPLLLLELRNIILELGLGPKPAMFPEAL